ncbi:MAG: protein phosphatase 2C domain-containing protein [Armatimonadota bacterium]|nr:protein phosphatase 2C domain-containing protein [Armatimonadota bacterium]
MDEEYTQGISWRVVGRSVMGASHTRSGKPNQDALGWQPDAGVGTTAILAVADGHGSAKCFRSERGSRLAVETALDELASLLAGQGNDTTAAKRIAQERLPQTIVRRWRQRVDDDLAREPLTDGELQTLARAEGEAAQRLVAEQPALAYGSTLLAAVATTAFLLYVQIGDGDILCVSDAGDVSRPVAGDARLIANETTSLCTVEAWKDFRVTFQPLAGTPPALIVLSSDGYANSFQNEAAFLQVGQDLHALIATEGLDVVADNLEAWLAQASQEGSGDDVTVAVLARADFEQSGKSPSVPALLVEPKEENSVPPKPRRPLPLRGLGGVVVAVLAIAALLGVWAVRARHSPSPPVRLPPRPHRPVQPSLPQKPTGKKPSLKKTPQTIPVGSMIPSAAFEALSPP